MKLMKVIVLLFAAAMFTAAINTAGIFNYMPVQEDMSFNESKITELTQPDDDVQTGIGAIDSIFSGIGFLSTSISIMTSAVTSIFTLKEVLISYGFPTYIADVFYGMLILISVFGLMKFILGRSDKGMD